MLSALATRAAPYVMMIAAWLMPWRTMVLALLMVAIAHPPTRDAYVWQVVYPVFCTAAAAFAGIGLLARHYDASDRWYATFVTIVLALEIWLQFVSLWPYIFMMILGIGADMCKQEENDDFWPSLAVVHMSVIGFGTSLMWLPATVLGIYFAARSYDLLDPRTAQRARAKRAAQPPPPPPPSPAAAASPPVTSSAPSAPASAPAESASEAPEEPLAKKTRLSESSPAKKDPKWWDGMKIEPVQWRGNTAPVNDWFAGASITAWDGPGYPPDFPPGSSGGTDGGGSDGDGSDGDGDDDGGSDNNDTARD